MIRCELPDCFGELEMNSLSRALLAGGFALVAISTSAHANLLTNGDFATGDFSGWTLSGDTSYTSVQNNVAVLGPVYGPGMLSQNVATTAGASYDISFTLGSTGLSSPGYFDAFFGNTLLFSSANESLSSKTHSFDAVASGSSETLKFVYFNLPQYYVLSGVSVAPVPEPSQVVLMLVGAGLMLAVVQRRKKLLESV